MIKALSAMLEPDPERRAESVDSALKKAKIDTARDALIEMVAEADDALMERFFESGTLTQEELVVGLKRGVSAGRVFPALCASAAAGP